MRRTRLRPRKVHASSECTRLRKARGPVRQPYEICARQAVRVAYSVPTWNLKGLFRRWWDPGSAFRLAPARKPRAELACGRWTSLNSVPRKCSVSGRVLGIECISVFQHI